MSQINSDVRLCGTGRHCREVSGPNMTTLGMLLWEKVTIDVNLVLQIFIGVCELLEETHNQGYAVGTLHPEGIVIVKTGNELNSVHIKKSGVANGYAYTDEISLPFDKSDYLSPEQLDGLSPSPRSDIYAIGSMMYTALTGAPPSFTNKSSRKKRLIDANRQLESVHEHKIAFLETVIKRCLKDDESKRYRSVEELKLELRGILDGVKPTKSARRESTIPLRKIKTFVASFAVSLLILFCMATVSGTHVTEPAISGVWNKLQYDYGDPFSITVTTSRKSYAYIIYVDAKDSTVSLYPSKDQGNNVLAAGIPLKIGTVGANMMHVDDSPGQIILVSIKAVREGEEANDDFLYRGDWIEGQPTDHCLGISGVDLLVRLSELKKKYPGIVDYRVDDAPRAKQPSEPLRFGKPERIELTLADQ